MVLCPGPSLSGLNSSDDDDRVADLQYGNVYEFAVGHNVSAVATVNEANQCRMVRTAWVPTAEVERVEPARLTGITLGMEKLAALASAEERCAALIGLTDQFEAWIVAQQALVANLHHAKRVETCETLVVNARVAANRIRQGIEALANPKVFRAFTLANAAMARQARRRDALQKGVLPDQVEEPTWRPFQLAFFLLNVKGIVEPDHADRRTVDLLFFPTGGGKTEAYLGLAAFTADLPSVPTWRGRRDSQVRRSDGADALHSAVTYARPALPRCRPGVCLGTDAAREPPRAGQLAVRDRSVGWFGGYAQLHGQAWRRVRRGLKGSRIQTRARRPAPVPLEKCPWCGASFTPDSFHLHPDQDHAEELRITCLGDGCEFTGDRILPIHMVDEPIYQRLPSFLIATVDKFAGMPWKGEIAKLFGRVKSYGRGVGFWGDCDGETGLELDRYLPPPELVIQDELHLISGPLGTIAGLFETAIESLCRDTNQNLPKIVSSTATVRRATDQIRALFGRGRVQIFPPPGPNRNDSFFAVTVPASTIPAQALRGRGRPGAKRQAGTFEDLPGHHVGRLPALSAGRWRIESREPRRSLHDDARLLQQPARAGGHPATDRGRAHQPADPVRQTSAHLNDTNSPFSDREMSHEVKELTSRYSTDKVAAAKDALNRPFRESGGVDVALATNMISVGLDIPRLGLMAVFSQPKMTSEYIQATSRVGRRADKPGLIVTIFNINRPRDRSHYERFRFFHETFYRSVEATSVTPFSPRALDRALFAVTTALSPARPRFHDPRPGRPAHSGKQPTTRRCRPGNRRTSQATEN